MADTTNTRTEDLLDQEGLANRFALTGVALANETVGLVKTAGNELLDVTESTSRTAFNTFDNLAKDWTGPFEGLVKAPVAIARSLVENGTDSGRRILAVA